MNSYDDFNNPFSDPFKDSSVVEASQKKELRTDISYDPFSNQLSNGQDISSNPTAAELQRRQKELDKRAEQLKKREESLHMSLLEPQLNFPPLPNCCPFKPCFYQDIEAEIPVQFQRLVTFIFYFWEAYNLLLIWNVMMCLTYFVVTMEAGLRNHSAVNFTLSILNFIIFCPASYVLWFRPAYKAFRYDSSINFFIFFLVFFMQFVTTVLQCLAIDGWGFVGILNSLDLITSGNSSALVVGAFMFMTGIIFGVSSAIVLIILFKVHQVYQNSGGSLAKAHMELTNDVKSSQVLQETAGNIAESAASQALLTPRSN